MSTTSICGICFRPCGADTLVRVRSLKGCRFPGSLLFFDDAAVANSLPPCELLFAVFSQFISEPCRPPMSKFHAASLVFVSPTSRSRRILICSRCSTKNSAHDEYLVLNTQ